jgi:tRNA nucleotidyltransferase (CCA-adding enzyme)
MKTDADFLISGMLAAKTPSCVWRKVSESFEELERSKGIIQKNNETVFDHTMNVLDCLEVKNEITLFAALFHDLGKEKARRVNHGGVVTYHHHEHFSANIAWDKLTLWQSTLSVRDRVTRIVQTHMFDIKNNMNQRLIRNFIADVGYDNVANWFYVREADARSYRTHTQYSFKIYCEEILLPFKNTVFEEIRRSVEFELTPGDVPTEGYFGITGE